MNRYRAGGPSKATPTTLCQKCLKKGHYTYECTAAQQERPYISRPSRSQQLNDPKLAPKLSATLPPVTAPTATPEKKVLPARPEDRTKLPRDRKRSRRDTIDWPDRKRRRSVSTHSSDSVSTISSSRSPPARDKTDRGGKFNSRSQRQDRRASFLSSRNESSGEDHVSRNEGQRRPSHDYHRGRRESPTGGNRSINLAFEQPVRKDVHRRSRSRSRSRSPYRGQTTRNPAAAPLENFSRRNRERSLSPYSQRVAMTKAMNAP